MGIMKRHLEEKIAEYAKIIGVTEQAIYENQGLYNLAVKFAQSNLDGQLKHMPQ